MPELDIGEVARHTGNPPATLRYYEERGLIAPIGRKGLRRVFDAAVLERLSLIAVGRTAGFSLDEISKMFGSDGRLKVDRKLLAAKAAELDKTIIRLTALRNGLIHAANCPAPSHMECPSFRRIVKAAVEKAVSLQTEKKVLGRGTQRRG